MKVVILLLVVLALCQGSPNNRKPNESDLSPLVKLLKKALEQEKRDGNVPVVEVETNEHSGMGSSEFDSEPEGSDYSGSGYPGSGSGQPGSGPGSDYPGSGSGPGSDYPGSGSGYPDSGSYTEYPGYPGSGSGSEFPGSGYPGSGSNHSGSGSDYPGYPGYPGSGSGSDYPGYPGYPGSGSGSDYSGYPNYPPMEMASLEDMKDLYMFPGSYDMIHVLQQWQSGQRRVDRLSDYFRVPSFDDLDTKITQYLELTDDSSDLSLLYTRMIVRRVIYSRFMCPSSVLDRLATKWMSAQLDVLFEHERQSMYQFFLTQIPYLINMPVSKMPEYIVSQMASGAVVNLHSSLFNDSMNYILGSEFRDVAAMSHSLYDALVPFLESRRGDNPSPMYNTLTDLVSEQIHMNDVGCRRIEEWTWTHMNTLRFFKDRFEDVEYHAVCEAVKDYVREQLFHFIGEMTISFAGDPIALVNMAVLDEICGAVKCYVTEVVKRMISLESVLATGDVAQIGKHMDSFVDINDVGVLHQALELLDKGMAIPNVF